jgi:hypothetical protein
MVLIKKENSRGIDDDEDGERSTRLSNIMNISSYLIQQNYG